MNASNQEHPSAKNEQQNQNKVVEAIEASSLIPKLQKLTNKKDNDFKNVEGDIAKIVHSFESLIGTLANDIKLDIIDTELGERLGKDMSEEDADKMLIVYGEGSAQDLDEWSLAKKRSKVVKLIEEFGKDDCKEYDLATKTRVASLKNKLVKALKAEVLDKIGKAVDKKVKDNNKDVEQKRQDLAKTEEYQKELQAIKQAQAEQAIRQTKKKRAARRKTAIDAAAEAGISATLDNCVQKTRENILSNFDNAVNLTKAAMNERVQENKDPQSEASEIREEVLETIKENSKYQLPEIKTGSDNVSNSTQAALNAATAGNISQEVRQTV